MLKYWLIFLYLIQSISVTAQKYAFERVPDIPYGHHIVQDAQGYIWFSDEQGLHKHNGINSYKLTEEDGFPGDFMVHSLTVDNKGYVWAASIRHGVAVIQPDTITFYNKKNGLLTNKATGLYKDRQKRIWVITTKGLALWTGTKFQCYEFRIPYWHNVLWEDQQGRLFFFDRLTMQIWNFTKNQSFKPWCGDVLEELNVEKVIASTTDRQGNGWFLEYPSTLIKYDGKHLKKNPIPMGSDQEVKSVLTLDYQDNLWIGTTQGAIKYDRTSFQWFRSKDGFSDSKVNRIYEDKEHVLWLLTLRGVYKYYGEQLIFWDQVEEIKHFQLYSFTENKKDHSIWAGTEEKGILRIKDNKIEEFITTKNGLPSNEVRLVYKDKKGTIWAATSKGLSKYDGQTFTTFTRHRLVENWVSALAADEQNRLWIGNGEGITLYDGKSFKKIPGLERYRINTILIDSKQSVWVGTNRGLFSLNNKKWQRFGKKEGLNYDYIDGIVEDHRGNLWIVSFRGGLYLYDHQTFRRFTEKDGLPLNTVYNIIFNKSTQQLWLHSNGISMLDLKEFYKTKQFKLQTVGKTEGTLGAFYKDSKDNLWFGNIDGFGRYDTKQGLPKSAPQLHLTSIKLFLKKADWQKYTDSVHYHIPYHLNLPYHQNHLTFAFVGITSRNAAKVRYQYKLEGNDWEWSPLSKKTEISYSNLPAGEYKFLVKALSNEGEWSKTLEYSFRIQVPFWQTTWFYVLVTLGMLLLLFGFTQWRTRSIRRRNTLLELKVEARTEEIKTQTEEIKAQAEELKQINERLVELDDFKQGVTGMIVHDLKNPLNSLLAHAKSPETRQSAQQMLHMVLNILDVQKLETTELQLHWDEFAINLLIKQALDQVMVLAQQKNVHFQWSEQSSFVVCADADLIQRVIINLLTNAIKHTPLNSVVYIQLEETPRQKLKLTVTDEGPGVSENLSNKVFDKFFSSGAEKQVMIKSTGLGLTFCKLAMEAHEEAIGVVNATEKGASFWFTLPLVNKEVTINKTQVKQPENDFILTKEAKNELLPYAQLLANAQVYEMGKIKSTIDQIKANADSPKAQWKEKMLEATFSMNQEWYDKLINLIINEPQ